MNPLTRRNRTQVTEAGFTLVEIMVVVVILGLLATLVAQNAWSAAREGREVKARADVSAIADAVRRHGIKHGNLPASLEVLATKDEHGYSELENLSKDPWDHDYILRPGNRPDEFEVISIGPDGSENTPDDISSKPKQDK